MRKDPNYSMTDVPVYDSANRPSAFVDEFNQLIRYRSLLIELISRDIKTRYKRSILGVAWTMMHPLLMMAILTFVFSNIFRFQIQNYPVYLLSGLLIWNLFTTTTTHAMTQLIWGGGLLNRIYLPKAIFAVSAVGTGLINLLLALIPLFLIMIVTGTPFRLSLLMLPVAILLTAIFSLGIGLFLSALAVYFADVLNMFEIILMMWLYATPIFYPIDIIPERFLWIMNLNPMYYLIELFRAPIHTGNIASPRVFVLSFVIVIVSLVIGWWYFTRRSDEFAYRV